MSAYNGPTIPGQLNTRRMNPVHHQPEPTLTAAPLPTAQLESLKFKSTQIIESINGLAWSIKNNDLAAMPSWPDILSKYNILLSQTLNFSNALLQTQTVRSNHLGRPTVQQNIYERIAIHPLTGMTEQELDTEAAPLLRNQQTLDVLQPKRDCSLGVLGAPPPAPSNGFGYGIHAAPKKPEYEDVLRECTEIRNAHDQRVDRAVRAVTMLRDKFDWKQRVEVEVEEPEELEWDPRFGLADSTSASGGPAGVLAGLGREDDEESSEDEENHVEDELTLPIESSPGLFSASGSGTGNTPAAMDTSIQ
ncbi:hypothetical protein AGABI2DRAFT_180830 [Agaricus bisporus var. bisporus H97]|uniref:hypothetical protein n=1 Tax=Agaricus bisporus var. bisporus (strain H97 / ATCC MYA-4626 / FGSC 10389) TaxID=936046 RepID=UPI00029F5CE3|nr:hypothetical protein AGABI2DRAFT_180830 [Agaricus bisporus var. bisporus H97]EKV43047.1 hypothetical protein AGABI2DRAFT_180830 [Agaricus bisporus var. bisporus H97]